ncbi:MAG: metal-dependent hydrolase [Gemmatales bacterium]|nr:metal-dependent hydrolase [Gemmatales bacterium]MDW8386675.1 metal-dependent hydrolase [Gemmatales bacterium]
MAAFHQHVAVSAVIGTGYGAALMTAGVEWSHSVLAGGLCTIAGMLPDLDSDSGKPVKELFGLAAAVVPMLELHRLEHLAESREGGIALAAVLYLVIRFGLSALFKRITVHRGMFHSLPAACIAGLLAFLAHDCNETEGRLVMAGGVFLGYLSHLILDEISSVDLSGLRIKSSAGSALKLYSASYAPSLFTWLLLFVLGYAVVQNQPDVLDHAKETGQRVVDALRGKDKPGQAPPLPRLPSPTETISGANETS